MCYRISLVFLFLTSTFPTLYAQTWNLSLIETLDEGVKESSGLVEVRGHWVSHNDSGNTPHLFELNMMTGEIIREVVIGNQTNIDWEDICVDEEFIYIGDFGNNLGSRRDLRVLKIGISDFLAFDTVQAAAIEFEYSDQVSFEPLQFQTNYDAETLISHGDSLYVFTKNWGDFKTNIYPIPKNPGSYSVIRYDSIDVNLMLTGGDTHMEGNILGLIGYNFSRAFFFHLPLDQLGQLHLLEPIPQVLNTQGSYQVEAFGFENAFRAHLSSENSFGGPASLYLLSEESTSTIPPLPYEEFEVFPNPSSGLVSFSGAEFFEARIVSSSGVLIETCRGGLCFLPSVPAGQYVVLFYNKDGVLIGKEKVIFH